MPRQRLTRFVVAAVFGIASWPTESEAQPTAPAAPARSGSDITISIGYEVHRDRLRYEFENPSSIDTTFLVPHKFVQTYIADNQWFVVSARYPLGGDAMQTEFGLTPQTTTFGDDFDTFFNPDGDVVVSGTAGDVSMRSLRFAHWIEAELWALPWRVGYVYRRDRARFHPAERLLTHSNPPSESRTMIDTRETTISQVHEIPIGVSKQVAVAPRWFFTAGADVSPVTLARLSIFLPDKYPGQTILFQAKVMAFASRLQLVWRRERWPVAASLHYGRTWSYRSSSQFGRNTLFFAVRIGGAA